MSRGLKVGRIFGIRITVDYTWFIVFVFFSWSLAFGYFPVKYPEFDKIAHLVMGVASAFLLFVCVLAHEISHSYVSNALGVRVSEITLFIFGGIAHLSEEPKEPAVELKIAIAGPLASLALAALFWFAAYVTGAMGFPMITAVFTYLSMINVVLVVFNMIPGFPLDGGRVLRAIWWLKSKNLARATRIASMTGRGFAYLLIALGAVQMLMGNISGLWSIFMGVFLQQAAGRSYEQLIVKQALEGVKVGDVMSKDIVTIDMDTSVAEAVDDYFLKRHYASFPVVSLGQPKGILMFSSIRALPKEQWPTKRVSEVMTRLDPQDMLTPDSSALDALVRMLNDGEGRLIVTEAGRIAGIISRRDILKLMEFKAVVKER